MDATSLVLAAGQVSVNTLTGRELVSYQGWSRHLALLQQGAAVGGAKLWYDRAKHHFYLLVSLTITTPDPTLGGLFQVLGIDLGQRYLATVTTPHNRTQFYSGKQVRATADHDARLQKRREPQRHSLGHQATRRHASRQRDGLS